MLIWLLALALTAVLVDVARRLAPTLGLVDSPDDRKSHDGDIPLVGGIAIFSCLLVAMGVFGVLNEHWPFFVAASVIVSVGVWDDVHGISPAVRLGFQAGAVLLIALFGNAYLASLGQLLPFIPTFELGFMAIPFTVFAGVGLINAFNMSDGVDGVCGTLTLVALTGLGIVASMAGRQSDLALILVMGGGLVGFLLFNMRLPGRKQAKVFLGDAGSYLLGLSVLYLTIRLTQGEQPAMAPVTALWFCMVPLFDTVGMILRRLKRGRSPFSPDREHIHHVFLLAKFSVTETWVGLTVVAVLGMVLGLAATIAGVADYLVLGLFVGAAFLYHSMMSRSWKVLTFLSRSINRRVTASEDRRSGVDRRQRNEICYIDGIAVERRSGLERRKQSDDRRNGDDGDEADADNVTVLAQKPARERPGSRAARVS